MTRFQARRTRQLFSGRVLVHTGRLPVSLPWLRVRPAPTGEPDPLDEAMHTVWLESGKWRWATQKMTTEAREAAVAAVLRHDRVTKDPDEPLLTRESVAWWD